MKSRSATLRRASSGRLGPQPSTTASWPGLQPKASLRPGLGRRVWQRLRWFLSRLFTPPRLQAFEFCDQAWLSGAWREAYVDCLNFLFRTTRLYDGLYHPFSRWARLGAGKRGGAVLDLCSGGGAHLDTLLRSAREKGAPMPRLLASDLFPNQTHYEGLRAIHGEGLDYVPNPVDALRPALPACRLRSIFAGFHHFPPQHAQRLLQDALQHADGLFVAEVFHRTWASVFASLPNLLLLPITPFCSGRPTLTKILITTLLPIIPFMVVFDGVISALRSYREEEIRALLPAQARDEWAWEFGHVPALGFWKTPYFFGYRKTAAAAPPELPE